MQQDKLIPGLCLSSFIIEIIISRADTGTVNTEIGYKPQENAVRLTDHQLVHSWQNIYFKI